MKLQFIIFACLLAIFHTHGRELPQLLSGFLNIQKSSILNRLGSRIIGGRNAQPGEFPHQVSLQFAVPKIAPYTHFCGGSILSENYILTAAHCVDFIEEMEKEVAGVFQLNFVVKAGKQNLQRTEDTEQVVFVEKRYKHDKWNGKLQVGPYDVAVLKLKTPLRLNKRVVKISLPKKNSEPDGQTVLSGWGAISNDTLQPVMPRILQTVLTQIVPRDECNKAIEAVGAEEGEDLKNMVHETNICTGPIEGGISACGGDSGGPLIKRGIDGQPDELVGIVSWGMNPCGRKGAPAVFVRVSSFIDWIDNAMKK